MSELNFNKDKCALTIIDMQQTFSKMAASDAPRNNLSAENNIARLLDAFRANNAAIFHIHHRNDAENSRFNPKNSGFQPMQCDLEHGDEPVIVKLVNSSFIDTDLEKRLRQAGIESVIICGVTINHCVETTTRMAGNLGFDTYLAHDATWTFDRIGPERTLHKADAIQSMSLANLHDEFCTIADTVSLISCMKQ